MAIKYYIAGFVLLGLMAYYIGNTLFYNVYFYGYNNGCVDTLTIAVSGFGAKPTDKILEACKIITDGERFKVR